MANIYTITLKANYGENVCVMDEVVARTASDLANNAGFQTLAKNVADGIDFTTRCTRCGEDCTFNIRGGNEITVGPRPGNCETGR